MYATRAQFGIYGLRREVLLPRSRTITLVDAAVATLGVQAHDFGGSEYLQLSTLAGSAAPPVLPAGLSASILYRPLPVDGSDTLFKLSLTEGGAAVTFSDAGTGTFVVTEPLGPTIDAHLEAASAKVDEATINYAPGLPSPPPTIVVWVTCKLAAYEMAICQSLVVPSYWEQARETIAGQYKEALEYLAEWKAGKPIQGLAEDATPDVGENDSVVFEPDAALPNWFCSSNGTEAV